ncbi:pilus assembly protein [Jiella sp. MQZ9-1]|uniref:Pilus assembly protein n=1 Tax=Jiella flava TaxID=2816857 RepID=A0A939FUW4_9HYPH|nr:TadE/TadG family type IV pilus assembly protein [Jiella flava]MBO0662393.1 pilus assembly protein [Jiella flava]MCD2471617.1 pilus assembly protein [Jiella flava]
MHADAGPTSAASSRPKRRGILPFLRDRHGVTTIEFAILAFPFFVLMLILLETATTFMAELVMDRAVAKIGREVRTGQITEAEMNEAAFKQKLCDEVNFLFDCSKLQIDLKTYTSFGDVPTSVPMKDGDIDSSGFSYSTPSGGKITALKAYYKWPIDIDFLRDLITDTKDHSFIIVGSAAFITEPY